MKNILLLLLFFVSSNLSGQNYKVDNSRIETNFYNLKKFGNNANEGNDRVAYSNFDIQARIYLKDKLKSLGAKVHTDFAGNVIAFYEGNKQNLKPISFGSHIDAVPNGGHYDGQVGVIASIEVLETIISKNIKLDHPLEMIIFSNEEGALLGSRALAGKINEGTLMVKTVSGYTNGEGVNRIGGDSNKIFEVKRAQGDIHAFLEMHIEQGNKLYKNNIDIGIVEGIVGLKWWDVNIYGFANHAGTTPMSERKDGMIAAAQFILMVNKVVNSFEGAQVGTVGRIAAKPGVPNVIPGFVNLSLELRDLSSKKIQDMFNLINQNAKIIAQKTSTKIEFEPIDATGDPALMDKRIMNIIKEASEDFKYSAQVMPSGAGHDAQDMALIAPTAMIFVPSRDGISHSPEEFTSFEMIYKGANVLLNTIVELDKTKLD